MRERQTESVCLYVHRSACLHVGMSVFLCVRERESVCVFVCVCLSINVSFWSVHLSVCLSIYLSIYLSVCLSFCQSFCLPICVAVGLSVCLILFAFITGNISLEPLHVGLSFQIHMDSSSRVSVGIVPVSISVCLSVCLSISVSV